MIPLSHASSGLTFSDDELRDIKKQLIEWEPVKWQKEFKDFEKHPLNMALKRKLHEKHWICHCGKHFQENDLPLQELKLRRDPIASNVVIHAKILGH